MSSGSASSPFQMKHWPLASSICRRLRGLPVLHSCRARHHPISHGSTHRFKISSSPRPPHTHKLPAPLFTQGPPSTPLLSRPDCRPGHEDHMVLRIESGDSDVCSECWDKAVLFAAGTDPYVLMEEAVIVAAECSGTAKPLRAKTLPPTLDSFGWCSWDSFYSTVSAQGLDDAVRGLRAQGTPPRWVVIDDGWQCTQVDAAYRDDPLKAFRRGNGEESSTNSRESFVEGEFEALELAARGIPAAGSAGAMLREVRSSLDPEGAPPIDAEMMALQKTGGLATGEEGRRGRHLWRRPFVISLTLDLLGYVGGRITGFFSFLLIMFYQNVVDPAPTGSWPARLWTWAALRSLREPLVQFMADSTNFTRRLTSVRANSKFSSPRARPEDVSSGAPADLASVVSHLRSVHGVAWVVCWHALSAYWSGVSWESPGMARYAPRLVYGAPTPGVAEVEPSAAWNPAVLGGVGWVGDMGALFEDMHAYLAAAGVAGVKVDAQAGVGFVGHASGGGAAAAARAHAALEASIAVHFPANLAVNCMCHSTENIYAWEGTALARVSDDFYPTDASTHRPHVAACAFNSLFFSGVAHPDWDMFQSEHRAAALHAAARAVSGGPVYVSDSPGRHCVPLLKRLVLPDGGVLRALRPGRPTRDSLFLDVCCDARSCLKVWNLNPRGGVLAAFNLQGSAWDWGRRRYRTHEAAPPPLPARAAVWDVEPYRGAPSGDRFAMHVDGAEGVLVVDAAGGVDLQVPSGGAVMVTVAPVVTSPDGQVSAAPLGLANMLNCGGAVRDFHWQTSPENGRPAAPQLSVEVRGCGTLLAYCSREPGRAYAQGVQTNWWWKEGRLEVSVPQGDGASTQTVVIAF
uniref:galactinol--sucrose galactosyltransferase n=1 Tax=Auxenochlorella protothecoides TaxID=3075 RepID=A0A1D2A580_AUXPR